MNFYFVIPITLILCFSLFRISSLSGRIGLGTTFILVISWLNYAGFCWHEFRFLSDSEKIDLAIGVVLAEWNQSVDRLNKSASGTESSRRYEKIANANDFKRLYPNCCKLYTHYNSFAGRTAETMAMNNESTGLGQQVPLFAKLTGCIYGYIEIKWGVPIYSNHHLTFGPTIDRGTRVSNCGDVSSPINYLR